MKRVSTPGGRAKGSRSGNMAGAREWVGGRLTLPMYVQDSESRYRPEVVLWVERPEDIVVGFALLSPDEAPLPFARALRDAMARPMVGQPRQPQHVRIADPDQAAEVRAFFGNRIRVILAPTPELDIVLGAMAEDLGSAAPEPSYFDNGVSAAAVAQLFESARKLYQAAPWKVMDDDLTLRLDIPDLKVHEACVSVIGGLGESLGFLISPSMDGFEAFLAASERVSYGDPAADIDTPIDLGGSALSLTFEQRRDLPPRMRREVSKHAWPVAGPRAYPVIEQRDRDGMPRPVTAHDVKLVELCASALTEFSHRHRESLEQGLPVMGSESYVRNGSTVWLTSPSDSEPGSERSGPGPSLSLGLEEPSSRRAPPGRNDPCPCGSGKKYKKCHYEDDQRSKRPPGVPDVHTTDEQLVLRMARYARERFGDGWLRAGDAFRDAKLAAQLFMPWSVYHFPVEGRPVVDWFVAERGRGLSDNERSWLAAQRQAWLSVWEVREVAPGIGLTVADLLTGETRSLVEVLGSRQLVVRDAVLGRVVDHGGISVFAGLHPRPLPPEEAAQVVRKLRGRLRRRGTVPVERLRHEDMERYLIACWEEEVAGMDERFSRPPELRNTDGDELLFTIDHFGFDVGSRSELEARLAALEDVQPPEPGDREAAYTFVRSGAAVGGPQGATILGTVRFDKAGLRLETNSAARGDRLRARLESIGRGLLHHRAREHSSPLAPAGSGKPKRMARGELPPEESAPIVQELMNRYYTDWLEQSIPALGGLTPRQAVHTRKGREQVEVLLKSIEHSAARGPAGAAPDVGRLRRELGLEG